MTATGTLAHSSLATAHSPLRTSGHGTPSHGSRSTTPLRVKPLHSHSHTDSSGRLTAPDSPTQCRVRRSSSAHALNRATAGGGAPAPHTSPSGHALDAAPTSPHIVTVRRRRLSVATYGDPDDLDQPGARSPPAPGPQLGGQTPMTTATTNSILSNLGISCEPLLLALAPKSMSGPRELPPPPSAAAGLGPSSSILKLQLPLSQYLVLGPEATVECAASHLAGEAGLRCVVVDTPGAAHVLGREEVERLARYSHDPASETLGSFLAGTPPAPAIRASASLGAAAGLLLRSGGQYLPVVRDDTGCFAGLVSRARLADALLGDCSDVYEAHPAGRPHGQGAGAFGSSFAPLAAAAAALGGAAAAASASLRSRIQLMPAPSLASYLRSSDPDIDPVIPSSALTPHLQPLQLEQHHQQHDDGDRAAQQPGPGPHHGQAATASTSSVLGSLDHSGPAEALKNIPEPINGNAQYPVYKSPVPRSGWELVDNADDVMDLLGLVGQSVNAEAVGKKLLGEAANMAGGSSGAGWLFKYLYDGDCAICRTFQAVIEKLDHGMGRVMFVDISQAFNPLEHGGINYKAAMETMHILSANGEVFKGVTAVIKLLVAVDADIAASMGSVTAVLPLLSLAYMVLSRNRHSLSGAWARVVRATGLDKAIFGKDIMGPVGLGPGSGLGARPPRPPPGGGGGGAGAGGQSELRPQPSA
ncbi:hypothetical protein GPECTOR_7g975 [Gonium pectorale]|uniref:CBS domain-containing protein n=1 Tax=Gonium pectorale TaxID=33097 RepID=A0A150GUI5_GONPE|nr:hypothetical protein GPECTOR_7g975 [Gonium pectorale]|eukprot:KXZ53525.1 hypothetical protein GPECTOR_7g975 [Gonium pectorale]